MSILQWLLFLASCVTGTIALVFFVRALIAPDDATRFRLRMSGWGFMFMALSYVGTYFLRGSLE